MDPITNAAQKFLEQTEACWRARPKDVLRLVVAPEHRRDLIAALRLAEAQPENRRPLFLVEAPFVTAESYAEAVCEAIAEDQEALWRGAQEEGVSLAPQSGVTTRKMLAPWTRIAASGTSVAEALGDRFDGIVVALVPERIDSPREWKAGIANLARAPRSERVRVAVLDLPGEPLASVLGAARARFDVDANALRAFIAAVGEESVGPAPSRAEPVGAGSDTKQGQASPDLARVLRRDLLAATEALRLGRNDEAVQVLETLRETCTRAAHVPGVIGATLALAGALSASGQHERAASAYRSVATLATASTLPSLECQAMLGEAASLFAGGKHREAASVYRRATAKAHEAGVAPLAEQSERMERACHTMLPDPALAPTPPQQDDTEEALAQPGSDARCASEEAAEVTGEAYVGGGRGPLPFVAKSAEPMTIGPKPAPRRPPAGGTGTMEFRLMPSAAVLPFQGPRVEVARASFMQLGAESPAGETETTGEVEVARVTQPATPFESASRTAPARKGESARSS